MLEAQTKVSTAIIKQGKSNNAADGSALDSISVWDMKCFVFLILFLFQRTGYNTMSRNSDSKPWRFSNVTENCTAIKLKWQE